MEISATPRDPVAVIGLGYAGCVTAACLARLGHRVIGIDRDPYKVSRVREGRAPFYEPGLEELVRENVAAGRLSASTCLEEGLREASIALVCVGTPSERNGNLNLEQLTRVCREIAGQLERRATPLVLAIRSTVWPGTCERLWQEVLGGSPRVRMVSNPEFLREGNAVRDFLEASLVVVGGEDEEAVRQVAGLYAGLAVGPSIVALRTAEMIKYACNAFHALKICFANEVGALCEQLEIPAGQVMETLCRDGRLNISPAYLKPGFAFGGSCLPKDLRALTFRASRLDLKLPLVESVLASNEQHLERAVNAVLDLAAQRIGVVGLAFKKNTDDVRESPVVHLLEQLLGKGRDIRVFDPHIRLEEIYGSNQSFLTAAIPHISRLLAADLESLLGWAEHLVITQQLSAAEAEKVSRSGLPVMDLAGGGFRVAFRVGEGTHSHQG